MSIQRLPAETIGQIAAGEVIERPAAAVKELIENAIDAGATRIDVTLVDGGLGVIEVRDNGCGIAIDDLVFAVERHCTSKISRLDDLDSLSTLGFRGEALASLAAVSRLTIRSAASGATSGGELVVEHGMARPTRAIAWGTGTSVQARDLFASVPARRKFMRSPASEAGYASRIVGAYALAYPSIAVTLEIDGRTVFATDGLGDRVGAAAAVWGADVAGHIVDLDVVGDARIEVTVKGVIALPTLDRSTRQQQLIFAQGRLVTSRQLAVAFEQAYHTLLMVGRHPIGCICVTVPPDRIDVNVHPTKSEVRFADDRLVFSVVQRRVRETLRTYTGRQEIPTVVSTPLDSSQIQRRLALSHPDESPFRQPAGLDGPGTSSLDPVEPGTGRVLPVLRVLGQIAATYIIAEGPDGMYLIDQHAAHERVMFERLLAQHRSRTTERQTLLTPTSIDLSPPAWESYQQCGGELAGLGFDIEPFGERSVVIRAVPSALNIRDPATALCTILEELATGGRGTTRLESLIISAACHSAIRAGQPLSLLEMRELIMQLEQCSAPQACGHGRPTMLRMTADELERQFSRR